MSISWTEAEIASLTDLLDDEEPDVDLDFLVSVDKKFKPRYLAFGEGHIQKGNQIIVGSSQAQRRGYPVYAIGKIGTIIGNEGFFSAHILIEDVQSTARISTCDCLPVDGTNKMYEALMKEVDTDDDSPLPRILRSFHEWPPEYSLPCGEDIPDGVCSGSEQSEEEEHVLS